MTDKKVGIVNIHGKDYMTVARRLELAHDAKAIEKLDTEVIQTQDKHVVIKANVTIKGVTYSGISSVNLESSKMIEKSNPYEVAETSAVGRALGFAGYGALESVASADEVIRATTHHTENGETPERQINEEEPPYEDENETQSPKCEKCGKPAEDKRGTAKSTGKPYHGIFCSSGDRTHTTWLRD